MEKDKYEQALIESTSKLEDCKQRVNNSCISCDIFFTCTLRNHYVKTVYESMSKDKSGGFEF